MPKPVVLCILDGWGHSDDPKDNAILKAKTPNFERFLKESPHSLLGTSGLDVGLPEGQMGNSEVGHMTIGSGRVIMQELPKIDQAVKTGTLAKEKAIEKFIQKLKSTKGACHLLGLVSDGGVHAHINHIIALAKIIAGQGVPVKIHAMTDGRDTAPNSAPDFLRTLEKEIAGNKLIQIATVMGRYYVMDRDKRWERIGLAYDAIISAKGKPAGNAQEAVKNSYNDSKTDEFLIPAVIKGYEGAKDGDGILMANFRADRARQITESLLDKGFKSFARKEINFSAGLGMVEYSEKHNDFMDTIFRVEKLEKILPEIIADAGLKQLRIAETEKYAHVTFFFSGGREAEFKGEERILIPSPKVATYDMQPEMSAKEVTAKLLDAITGDKFDFIVVNFANTDMVGHTGIIGAAVKAVEAVDESLGKIAEAVKNKGGIMLITADHGNAELMVDPETGVAHTQHTLNPVPCVLVGLDKKTKLKNGRLSDIAPTLLEIMKLPKPKEMNGNSLIIN